MPKGVKPDVLSYWYQEQGGPIFNDCICVARRRRPSRCIAHRFLNYLLDNKVAYENFAATSATSRRSPRSTPQQALRRRASCPKTLQPGRRHARGLRQRQRLPDALGQGPAALGPHLGVVPQRLMGVALDLARARASRPRLAGASSSSSPSTRSSASAWATSPRSTSRSRTGTRSTGTSATSGRRSRTSCPGGRHVGRLPAHDHLRRRRGRALAGHRLPGRLVRRAPRRALARR